jgi:hypothetical protein
MTSQEYEALGNKFLNMTDFFLFTVEAEKDEVKRTRLYCSFLKYLRNDNDAKLMFQHCDRARNIIMGHMKCVDAKHTPESQSILDELRLFANDIVKLKITGSLETPKRRVVSCPDDE